jgi:hypothetical protein
MGLRWSMAEDAQHRLVQYHEVLPLCELLLKSLDAHTGGT